MATLDEILESAKARLTALGPLIDSAKAKLTSLGEGEGADKAAKDLSKLTGEAGGLKSMISSLGGAFAKFTGISADTSAAMSKLHPAFSSLGKTLKNDLGTAVKNVAELIGVSLSPAMRSLYNPLDESTDAVGMLGMVSNTAAKALLGLHAASKNLIQVQDSIRTAFVTGGRVMEDADKAAKTYAQGLRDASSSTSFGAKAIDSFNKQMGKHLPDSAMMATTKLTEISDVMGKSVMPTTVAMTAFRAFGIEGAEAARGAEDAFKKFNQAPIETARQLGLMKRAANAMGVNMGLAREQILKASGHVAIFGQKTGSATSMWTTFAGALKDKVPIEEVGKMVDQLTGSLAKMEMKNRAFISMMSGLGRGSTAIGGALKMELAMRGPEGMEKHMQGLTQTLAKFAGGKVISLEQAAQNPQLEQQFVLQRQMLGKLTGITSQEQQNRVLETLQKVQSGGMSQIEASGTLKEVLKSGKSLQEKQLTVLEKMLQHMRAAFGSRLDVKLDEATNTIRDGLNPLQDALREGAGDPTRNVMNQESFGAGMGHAVRGMTQASRRLARTTIGTGLERHGQAGVQTLEGDALSRTTTAARSGGRGFLDPLESGRKALRPSDVAAGRVRAPVARRPAEQIGRVRAQRALTIPGFRTLTTNVAQGNQTIHRDLQNLIRITRDGFSPLKEGKLGGEAAGLGGPKATGAGEKTITVRIVGDEQKVLEKLGNEIEKSMKEYEAKQQKNTLGISGD